MGSLAPAFACLAGPLLLLGVAGGFPSQGRLELANGDFESGLEGWVELERGSGRSLARIDKETRSQGRQSLRLERESRRLLPEDGVLASLSLPAGLRRLQLGLAARVDAGVQGVAVLQAFDRRGVALATARELFPPAGKRFARHRIELELPEGCERLEISLRVRGAGSVWFDALELQKG